MSAAAIAAALKQRRSAAPAAPPLPWQLVWLPLCASTETELDRRLAAGARAPLALIARRQTCGRGQQGRPWQSPAGGVWLSAALPWHEPAAAAAAGEHCSERPGMAAPALAVTLGLALQLEGLGLRPQIKWPNDLLLDGRKLAGILPRLRWRGGRLLGCRVGIGINGVNPVPPGAIALRQALAPPARRGRGEHPLARPDRLAALVLGALDWAVAASGQPELVRRQAEGRLWREQPHRHQGLLWQVDGLTLDGALRLSRAGQLVELRRDF